MVINGSLTAVPRKAISWTLVASLYFIMCMYLVSVANSTTDDLNPNSMQPVYLRQVLVDPLMSWVRYWVSSGVITISADSASRIQDNIGFGDEIILDFTIPSNLPDIFIAVSVLMWLLRLVSMPSLTMGLALLRRTFWITGTAYLLRAACVLMTILPFPYVECDVDKRDGANSWIDAFNIMFMKRSSCGDVFYSGHTVVYSIACLTWLTYSVRARLHCVRFSVALFLIAETLLACLSLLAVGYHYSIDIIVSALICSTMWLLYHTALRIYETHLNQSLRIVEPRRFNRPSPHSLSLTNAVTLPSSSSSLSSHDIIVDIDDYLSEDTDDSHPAIPDRNVVASCRQDIKRLHGSWVIFICIIDGK